MAPVGLLRIRFSRLNLVDLAGRSWMLCNLPGAFTRSLPVILCQSHSTKVQVLHSAGVCSRQRRTRIFSGIAQDSCAKYGGNRLTRRCVLAGSECANTPSAARQAQLAEACHSNTSLSVLGRVIIDPTSE